VLPGLGEAFDDYDVGQLGELVRVEQKLAGAIAATHDYDRSRNWKPQDTSADGDAVGVIRARHWFDRRRGQSLWPVWREWPWMIGHRLIRIDRWIRVGVAHEFHPAASQHLGVLESAGLVVT